MIKATKKKATKRATPKKRVDRNKKFLAALSDYGNVSRAAREAGLDRCTLYRKYRNNPAFAKAWDEAIALGVDALEDEAKRRAYEGWQEPVWHKGEQCGAVSKFSDTLLIVLLKAHKPEKYQEKRSVELGGPAGGPIALDMGVSPAVQEIIDRLSGKQND